MQIVQVLQPSYCSLQFARWETIPPCRLPLTDFHSIYFIIVNPNAPIIAHTMRPTTFQSSNWFFFQPKISKISKIVTLLQNHKKKFWGISLNLKSIEIQIRRLHRGVSPIVAFCTVTSQHRASGDPRAICRLKKWRHYSHPIWTHIYTFVWYSAQFFIYV